MMTRTRSRFLSVMLVGLAIFGAAASARAQSTASLQGAITDTQGAVMPGVSITIRNTATGIERATVSDNAGQYVAAALAPGHYSVVAHLEGFKDQTGETDLGPAQTGVLNLRLGLASLSETVTVAGASPIIDTATVSVGQVMAERTVQEIPLNGRHFVDLGPLMPGGSTSPQNAGLSAPLRGQGAFSFMSAGNRETSVNMMLNGINLNDLSNSQVTFQPSINTVSEFKVDNSTFSAEYGRNSGAIVNVATRSGSNQLHGEGFDFYRDQKFDSRNYFNPPSIDTSGNVTPQSLFNRKQFGVNLGGPVVKNRSFFFGSYEGLRHLQGVDMNSGTLTDAQRAAVTDPLAKKLLQYIPVANDLTGTRTIGSPLAPVTIDQYTIDSRNNLRQNDDLHFYYAFQKDSRLESNAQGQTVPGYPDRRGGHRQIMTINETHIFSPALVNELRVGFNRISITFIPQTLVDTNALGINVGQTAMPIALPAITISGPGLVFGGPAGFPSGREVTTFAAGDTATYLHGNHIVKFGGEIRRVKHYGFGQDPGRFTYPSVAAFQQGFGSQFSITLGTQAFNAYVNAIGGFVQDSVSLGSNLKLDLGLRYDYLPSPTEADNKLVGFDPAAASLLQINGTGGFTQVTKNGSDFQPRVGLIWNPKGDGKTVVRSAYAIMVNQSNTGYFTGETGNPPIVSPFSGQASGTAASNLRLDTAVSQAGSAALAPSFTDPNFLPGHADVECQRRARDRHVGPDGRLLRIPWRSPAHPDQPQSVHDAGRHPSSVRQALGSEPDSSRHGARKHHGIDEPRVVRLQGPLGDRESAPGARAAALGLVHALEVDRHEFVRRHADRAEQSRSRGQRRRLGLRRPPSRLGQHVVRLAIPRQPPQGRLAARCRRAGADGESLQHRDEHHDDYGHRHRAAGSHRPAADNCSVAESG
jgi:hypothetical protein